MPLATSSQAVMPPKTFTNTLLTCGSLRITSRPSAITWAFAPPPMSRKLAGLTPPCASPAYATTSRVDMTRPAPLPMMPTCAVELDVVEALLLGLRLERVGLVLDPRTRACSGWRNSAFSSSETLPSSASSLSPASRASGLTSTSVASSSTKTFQSARIICDGLLEERPRGSSASVDDLAGLGLVDTGARVDRDLLDGVGVGLGDLLDLDTALDAGDAEVLAVRAVEQEGEVVLLLDASRPGRSAPG